MTRLRYLSAKEKKALAEFKEKLLQKLGKEVLVLKLFGSKVRGDFKKWPDSDIDILVVLKQNSPEKEEFIMDISFDMFLKYEVLLSPKVFSQKEYKKQLDLQLPFFLILEKEAKSLL